VLGCWGVGRPQTDQCSILWLMNTLPKVRDVLEGHITLELDSIDRLYLNGYVPQLHGNPAAHQLPGHADLPSELGFPTVLLVSSVPRLRVELTPLLAYCHKIYKERQIDSMVVL